MRPDVVVLPPSAFGKDLDLLERVEDLAIEKLVPQPAKSYYRDFDRSFDPERSPVYKTKKQVDW